MSTVGKASSCVGSYNTTGHDVYRQLMQVPVLSASRSVNWFKICVIVYHNSKSGIQLRFDQFSRLVSLCVELV